jgi:hypothetical protein
MAAANIDMVSRDFCAHILIKLNECRCVAALAAAWGVSHSLPRVAGNPAALLCAFSAGTQQFFDKLQHDQCPALHGKQARSSGQT